MKESSISTPSVEFFRLWPNAVKIKPSDLSRPWMNQSLNRSPYRCTPLNIANTSGWTIHAPAAFEAEWDGGHGKSAINISLLDHGYGNRRSFVSSHFGNGVLTFHIGWLIRTSPGWAIWARGCPNTWKEGIAALDGLIETDWLPYAFTMNWRFTRPGIVRFAADEPFCFITIFPHAVFDNITPVIRELSDDIDLEKSFVDWATSRSEFNHRLRSREPHATQQGWQKKYLKGSIAKEKGAFHISKRKANCPVRHPTDKQGNDNE